MNTMKVQKERNLWAIYATGTCILFCLFWKLPMMSDDFEFADLVRTQSLDEVVNYILYYGNGRLLGNTLSIAMVNANFVISAAVKTIAVLGIIILMPRVLGIHSTSAILVSFLLVLGMAPQIYAQVFIWTSGFVNFTFSVFLSLLCVHFVQTAKKQSAFQMFVIAVTGAAGQLFVEHVTIINVVVSVGMVLYFYRKDTIKRDAALSWLVGCILGAVMMLLLPRIFYIEGNRTQGYREIHTDSIASMFRHIFSSPQLMVVTLSRCTLLFSVISCFGWLMHRNRSSFYNCYAKVVYLIFPVVSLLFNIRSGTWIPAIVRYVAIYGGLLIYCLVVVIDVLKIEHKKVKTSLLCLVFLAMLSAAPFLIVTPFGERCLFLAYSFLAMFAMKAIYFAVDNQQICFPKAKFLLMVCAMLLSSVLLMETAGVRKWNAERNDYIETCMAHGQESICIYEIPSPYNFQTYLIGRWYYYESWHDISFEIIEYETWLDQVFLK